MKMPIPNDWDGSTFCNFLVRWPQSTLWRIILRGLLSNPSFDEFWDGQTGNITDVIEDFRPALDQNLDELECTNMNIPVGTIWIFAGENEPAGWLFCQGQTLNRVDYADLFEAIGVFYGAPDANTFNLPDLRGRVPVGHYPFGDVEYDELGETGGEKTHELITDEIPSHTHVQNSHNHTQDAHNHTQDAHNHTQNAHAHQQTGKNVFGAGGNYGADTAGGFPLGTNTLNATATNQAATATNQAATATNQAATATNQNAGGGAAHNNLQPYQVLNYIIRSEP